MMVENFVFCGWCFSNQFDVVLETHFNCDTVGRELWLAMLSSLLCPAGGSVAGWSAFQTRNPAALGLSPALTTAWICFSLAPS